MSSDPPSYQDSLTNSSPLFPRPQAQLQASRLHNQLTTIRTAHISKVITDSVLPVIHYRAAIGLSQTNIALIPGSITSSTNDSKPSSQSDSEIDFSSTQLLGLASHTDEDLQQLPLTAPMDTTQFWSQAGVINDLRRLLGHRLEDEGYGSWGADEDLSTTSEKRQSAISASTATPPSPAPRPKPKSVFSRRSTSSAQMQVVVEQTPPPPPVTNRITVQVGPEEVCLRTQSAFGLYETLTRSALLVRVEIRG